MPFGVFVCGLDDGSTSLPPLLPSDKHLQHQQKSLNFSSQLQPHIASGIFEIWIMLIAES